MLRRRIPTDLPTLRRSRSSLCGAITKAKDKLAAIQETPIPTYSIKTIERLVTSVEHTESKFLQTLDEAQDHIPEDDSAEDMQAEEDEALKLFNLAILEVRELAEELLAQKRLRVSLDSFNRELETLKELVEANPDRPQDSAIIALESQYIALLKGWEDTDLPPGHELETDLHQGRKFLTTLKADLDASKDRSAGSPSILHSSFSSRDSDRSEEGKLPYIEVPLFHGDIMKWSTFWANFKALIDSRDRLSETSKLIYLRRAIKDPECQTLLNIPRETPDSYKQVVATLQARFDRTKEIHRKLVQRVLDTSPAKLNRLDLRRLKDNAQADIESIKGTGHYTIDTFLTSLYYNILPIRLQTLWDQHNKKSKKVAPVQDLLDFVSEHAETLPATASTAKTPSDIHEKKPKPKQGKGSRANIHVVTPVSPSNSYKWECVLCKPEKHPLFVCPKWQNYSIPQRLAHIQDKKLCQNCLAVGHSAESCRSSYKCRDCGLAHHTTIHQAPAATTLVHTASVRSHQVPDALMMTAKVLVTEPGGQTTQARALIDPGAGMSMVSSKIANLLHLPLIRSNIGFSAVQGTVCKPAHHLANLTVSPLQGSQTFKVEVQPTVVRTVTCDLPAQEIAPVGDLPHLSGLELADPSFHLPGKIDLLLGAEVYPQLLIKEPVVTGDKSDPAAQKTIFGWAIVGPARYLNQSKQPVPTYFANSQPSEDDHLSELLARFSQTEEVESPASSLSAIEEQVQNHYALTTTYSSSPCRYQVALPRRDDVPPLGESRSQALCRYIANEKAILRRNIYKPFQDVVQGYLDLGHAEAVPASELSMEETYYLPMHSVSKQSSTSEWFLMEVLPPPLVIL